MSALVFKHEGGRSQEGKQSLCFEEVWACMSHDQEHLTGSTMCAVVVAPVAISGGHLGI